MEQKKGRKEQIGGRDYVISRSFDQTPYITQNVEEHAKLL